MLFAILSLLAAIISVLVARYAWRHPSAPGSRPFGLVSLGSAIWQLGYACEISGRTLFAAVFWDNLEFLGTSIIPAAFLVFVLQYCGYRAGSDRRLWALLAIEPIITSTLAWTNHLHGLIRGPVSFTPAGPLMILSYAYGPWMWLSIVYVYALIILSIALLTRRFFEIPRNLRSQIRLVLIGGLIPWIGTIFTIIGLLPVAGRNLDLTPLTFLVGNLIWFWALFRHRLFSIVPVAYETLVGSMADGVIMVDEDRRVVLMNPAAERIVGCSTAEATGRTVEQVLAEWPGVESWLSPGHLHRVEIGGGRRDAIQTFDVQISEVRDAGDARLGQLIILRDITQSITDQRRFEEALRRSERRHRVLLEAIPDTMFRFSVEGLIIDYYSPDPSQLYTSPESFLGRRLADVVPGSLATEVQERIPRLLRDGGIDLLEYALPIGGQDQYFEARLAAAEPDSVIAIVRNVTARKQAEAELAYKSVALARARDAALEASRLKSEFLATMSHEIRTPLNAIIGMGELMLDTPLDDDQHEFASVIQQSSHVLLALINDILDFSKIEAGKLALASRPFGLRGLVEEAAGLLAARAREKGLALSTFVAPELPAALIGDDLRLRQVLLNLISNAVKFTERGEVVLRAELERDSPDAVSVRFSVTDTGIGLSEDARRWLFQPFTQADGSMTRKYGGTGLGLAISRRLSELMGGEIGVESVEGQGSTFWFTTPFARADEAGPPASPHPTSEPAQAGSRSLARTLAVPPPVPPHAGSLILLAEDNIINRRMASLQLERLGYTVNAVENGREALEEIVGAPGAYALILMDVQMPVLDGFATTQHIRAAEAGTGRHTPIIAMTANALEGDRERCLEAGMDDYMAKPVVGETLRAMIERWLGP